MRVLLTRAEEDAVEMKARLEQAGIEAAAAPLISVMFEPMGVATLEGANALVATSRNALKALGKSSALERARALPLFAVGPATSTLANEMGFSNVIEGPGTAAGLADVIKAKFAQEGFNPARAGARAQLLHLAGDETAFDLRAAVSASAIEFRTLTAYRVVEATNLPEAARSGLEKGEFGAVVLMSPRTAAIWARLILAAGLKDKAAGLTHVCLSQAVTQGLNPLGSLDIAVVSRPDGREILMFICKLAKGAATR